MNREPRIAVVDQGSTTTKAALLTLGGETVSERSAAVARADDGGRITHDPDELAAAVEALLGEQLRQGGAAAIGIACQRSTCLVWDRETGAALTPALSWQDTSESSRVEALGERGARVARRTGLRPSPHYAAPKLARLLEELPRGAARAEAGELVAGTLDAFLLRRLTGRETTEPGLAGRTLLYDFERGVWDPELCELWGIPAAALPELLPSAGARGVHRGVPVTALAGDQQAALLGHGGWRTGVAAAHFGTGAFILASTGVAAVRHPELLSAVLAATERETRFQLEGSVNSAGSAVDWARRVTGESLEDWADRPLEPERLPRVLPAFTGAAAPWWRPRSRAVVAALGLDAGGAELLGGVLCGVAMRVLDCVEALTEVGAGIDRLRVSGKLTRLSGLVGLLADAGQLEVEVSRQEETGLDGIARLAAAGLSGDRRPLEAPVATRMRRQPGWPAARADGMRSSWREFVERALDL